MCGALLATNVQAQDRNAEFTAAVEKCWNRPSTDGQMPKIVWTVEIDDHGELVDITAETPRPKNRAVVESLQRATLRCAPYRFPAGVYKLIVDSKSNGGKSLDPYK